MSRKIQKVILLLDNSGSMNGQPIIELKRAVNKLSNSLRRYDRQHSRVDLQIISFSSEAKFVSRNKIDSIQASGMTNLADAYKKLSLIFNKHKHFDYPPIILLMCDGYPNVDNYTKELEKLYLKQAFKKSVRMSIAYGRQSKSTMQILANFAGGKHNLVKTTNADVIRQLVESNIPREIKKQAFYKRRYL